MSNSRDYQDIFVFKFFKGKQNGSFVDIGCQYPIVGNNTYLLEINGWTGISLDIIDYNTIWKSRSTPFIQCDALNTDFTDLFNKHNTPEVVDYLSLDVEGNGDRFDTLVNVFKSNKEFKVITIEHDAYAGYAETERARQREFLLSKNYILLASNLMCVYGPFEDWWINPKFFNIEEYDYLISENLYPNEIVNKIK